MDIAADNPVRTPGPVLAAERERQGLSRADMASRLRISTTQVEAMENDDYARLPRGTFLRGFVRNYAKALGLDATELVAELDRAQPRATAPGIVVPTQNIRFDPLGQRFTGPYVKAAMVAATVVVLAFAALYWWFFMRPGTAAATTAVVKKPAIEASLPVATLQPEPVRVISQPGEAPVPTPPSPPLVTEPAPATARIEAAQPPVLPAIPFASPATAKPAIAAPVTAASEPPPPGSKSLRFAFSGASWVEIKDARGRTLISKVNPKGVDAEVVGKPPFTVWIGNAPEVKMSYEGKEFDLAPHTRAAVARFTLD
jgi:cytoskeleton protein RodZ